MDENSISKVKSLLYDCTKDEVQTVIRQTENTDILYLYAYNYNWDNGFEIPQLILDNEKCDLSTALLIFFRADGELYLFDKSDNKSLPQWSHFVKKLYDSVLEEKYPRGAIRFITPLTKVQVFKLRKILSEQEKVFMENIEGKALDINL